MPANSATPQNRQPPGKAEIRREMVAILLLARHLLMTEGWARGEYLVDERGAPKAPADGDPWTLVQSLIAKPYSDARHQARLLVTRIAGHHNLVAWNAHPYRTGQEVIDVLDKAIREVGGVPPRARKYRDPREPVQSGGWRVSSLAAYDARPRAPKKHTPKHVTRAPAKVGRRIIALCTSCQKLVVVKS